MKKVNNICSNDVDVSIQFVEIKNVFDVIMKETNLGVTVPTDMNVSDKSGIG